MIAWFQQFGIRARLFMAFGAIAGTTVVASVAACLLFSQVGELMNGVAQRNIPEVIASLELATQTEALAASAPALLGSENQEQRTRRLQALKSLQDGVTKRLEMVADFKGGPESIKTLSGLNTSLNDKLAALDRVVGERLGVVAQRLEAGKADQAALTKVSGVLSPALEAAQTAITMVSMNIGTDPSAATMTLLKLVSKEVPMAKGLADLVGHNNLAGGVLTRAAIAPSAEAVEALRKEYGEVVELANEKLDIVENLQSTTGLRPAVEAFLARGTAKGNVFELRIEELRKQVAGQKILDETRAATASLNAEVTKQVDAVRSATKQATDSSDAAIGFGSLVMVAIAAASMIGSGLIVWLYIGRNLVRRITGLEGVMTRLAAGDLTAEVNASGQTDEIGQMAKALAVFRDGLVRANALAAEQAKEQEAKQKRAAALEALTMGFNEQASAALGAVAKATADMHGTAQTMATVAQQATDQTAAVASASTEAAANVQTVAAATEELSSSVAEIGRQVAESTRIADQAVQQVSRSQTTVTELSEAAQKIGEVVGLINTIAGQTNLLALNATIEAARAGEAGKGFAVVASEVKNLANQTAQATENITAQVAAIQTSTGDAVKTMKEIGDIIGRIAEIATTIAAAVEEQGAATQEIARNVQEAAAGTQEVSTHIAGVSQVAGQTGDSAAAVLAATERLTKESELLRGQVDSFLAGIKAA